MTKKHLLTAITLTALLGLVACDKDDNQTETDNAGTGDTDTLVADDAVEPTDDSTEPTDDAVEPADDTTEPADDAVETTDDAVEPTDDTEIPDEDTVQNPNCPEREGITEVGEMDGMKVCEIAGVFTDDLTLESNKIWVLNGSVTIGENSEDMNATIKTATLTIQPGTLIMGGMGDQRDFLVINRGSKIIADGTKEKPIRFTSVKDDPAPGDWGGLMVNGWAPVNCGGASNPCQRQAETGVEWYGGDKADDNSGILRYVIIEYSGYQITSEKEFNGLTLQGVGNGTTIEYVVARHISDDGIEFFGGTVNAKYLYVEDAGDDGLDWTFGYSGKVQFAIVKQTATTGDRGMECDTNDKKYDDTPVSTPILSNITLLGDNGEAGKTIGINLRHGSGGFIHNTVVKGFVDACLDLDDVAFTNAAADPAKLAITHTLLDCVKPVKENDEKDANGNPIDDPWDLSDWFDAQEGNLTGDAKLDGYIPQSGSPLLGAGQTPNDAFFTEVDFIGAVKDAESDWTKGWVN